LSLEEIKKKKKKGSQEKTVGLESMIMKLLKNNLNRNQQTRIKNKPGMSVNSCNPNPPEEDPEFKANLGNIGRPCLKNKQNTD
jgi:hypothetical protein